MPGISKVGQDAPKTMTGIGAVPTSKDWLSHGLSHGCCILGTSGCHQSNVALLPPPKPLLWGVEAGKPEATLQLGSVGLELGECGGVMPLGRKVQAVLLHWI